MHSPRISYVSVNLMIESRERDLLDSSNYYVHDYLCTEWNSNWKDIRPTMIEVMILAFANYDSNKVTRNTREDIRKKESSSHITKNISVTGIDEALAHAIFTSDVDSILLGGSVPYLLQKKDSF